MRFASSVIAPLIAAAVVASAANGAASGAYLYSLSDSTGKLDLGWASLSWDPAHGELYAVSGGVGRGFNEAGMEVFSFDDLGGRGSALAVAVREDGELLVLARDAGQWSIVRCNYRGEAQGIIKLAGVPAQLAGFQADSIFYRAGRIYLSDKTALQLVVASDDGAFVASWDLGKLVGQPANGKSVDDIRGLSVDPAGNVLFTIPTLFSAFVLFPDGTLRAFGRKGSLAGRFNIASGITGDEDGNYYVADTLRAVVMVFDKQFKFQGEFGYRGQGPSNLIAPSSVAVGNGRVFVGQSIGPVKVFGVQVE